MIHAIIDIGSNTVRMAIYKIEKNWIELLLKKKYMIGLASYLQDGIMQPQGIDKTCEAILEFKSFLTSFQIKEITAFTTAALRNAKNSQEAVQEIVDRTGIPVRVISGDEEAVFDFIGATHEMKSEEGILADIGGASTEIVFYRQSEIVHKTSLPIGSLSLQVKYVEDILPNSDEIADMEKEVHNLLKKEDWLTKLPHYDICGIGGTFKGARSLYNILYDLTEENKEMEAEKFGRIIEKYHRERGISQEDVIYLMRAVPDRINTIIPGMVIAKELALSFHSDILTYSDSGVREGYIYDQIIGKRK